MRDLFCWPGPDSRIQEKRYYTLARVRSATHYSTAVTSNGGRGPTIACRARQWLPVLGHRPRLFSFSVRFPVIDRQSSIHIGPRFSILGSRFVFCSAGARSVTVHRVALRVLEQPSSSSATPTVVVPLPCPQIEIQPRARAKLCTAACRRSSLLACDSDLAGSVLVWSMYGTVPSGTSRRSSVNNTKARKVPAAPRRDWLVCLARIWFWFWSPRPDVGGYSLVEWTRRG